MWSLIHQGWKGVFVLLAVSCSMSIALLKYPISKDLQTLSNGGSAGGKLAGIRGKLEDDSSIEEEDEEGSPLLEEGRAIGAAE